EMHDGRPGTPAGFGYRIVYVEPARIAAAVCAIKGRSAPLPFVREPVSGNATLARAVTAAFWPAPAPLGVDAVGPRLAEGLLAREGRGGVARVPPRFARAALERARAYLDGCHTVVRSGELQRVTGLDRYELARQFRAAYGTSPYRYSLLRRLDFARQQLGGAMPLAELALAAGFADQAHFTRMFRQAVGVTPGRHARLRAPGSARDLIRPSPTATCCLSCNTKHRGVFVWSCLFRPGFRVGTLARLRRRVRRAGSPGGAGDPRVKRIQHGPDRLAADDDPADGFVHRL